MRAVHERLREALEVTRQALADGEPARPATRDLLLFCHGFCAALTAHHEGEDHSLFPAIATRHPGLRDTLDRLRQDHSMIGYLLSGLVLLPIGFLWSLAERSRGATAVLMVAGLAQAFVVVRALQVWTS